jgi:hypothetical protein
MQEMVLRYKSWKRGRRHVVVFLLPFYYLVLFFNNPLTSFSHLDYLHYTRSWKGDDPISGGGVVFLVLLSGRGGQGWLLQALKGFVVGEDSGKLS